MDNIGIKGRKWLMKEKISKKNSMLDDVGNWISRILYLIFNVKYNSYWSAPVPITALLLFQDSIKFTYQDFFYLNADWELICDIQMYLVQYLISLKCPFSFSICNGSWHIYWDVDIWYIPPMIMLLLSPSFYRFPWFISSILSYNVDL